jgi:excisionase family DNA binding protein
MSATPHRQLVATGPLLDAKGAAELLAVPASWVLAEARADRIPHVRLGRYVRFSEDELSEWCQSRRRGPQPAARDLADRPEAE